MNLLDNSVTYPKDSRWHISFSINVTCISNLKCKYPIELKYKILTTLSNLNNNIPIDQPILTRYKAMHETKSPHMNHIHQYKSHTTIDLDLQSLYSISKERYYNNRVTTSYSSQAPS